jgi:hypothetical protein
MKFPEKTLRLLSVRKGVSEKGNNYCFVKLADEATFESEEFMLNRDQSPDFLTVQQRYIATLNVEGRFSSVELVPEKTGKAA